MSRFHTLRAAILAVAVAPLCTVAHADGLLRSVDVTQDGACVQTHIRLNGAVRGTSAIADDTANEIVIPVETIGTGPAVSGVLDGPADNIAGLKNVVFETGSDGSRLRIVFSKTVSYHLVMEAETRHLRIDANNGTAGGCTVSSQSSPLRQPTRADNTPASADPVAVAAGDALPSAPAKGGDGRSAALIDNSSALRGSIDPDTSLKSLRGSTLDADPVGAGWSVSGGVSQGYYRDDLFTGAHAVEDSRLISTFGVQAKAENLDWAAAARLDALQQTGIGLPDNRAKTSLSTAYLELKHKRSRSVARLGRQSRDDGGIFGRFDGAWLGLEATDRLGFGLAAGSPVYARNKTPFADDIAFLSARATYALRPSILFADIYAIEQHAGAAIDRRALGAEIRHETQDLSANAGADYDIHLDRWSSAYASANWQANERLSFNAALDYRTTPFLLTSNALVGQDEDKLPSLVRLLGENHVLALAGAQTSDAVTASAGLSYQLSQRWHVTLDGLLMDARGTITSPDTGADMFVSAYAYGDQLIMPNGSGGAGLSFAQNQRMSKISSDIFLKYPLTDKLTLSPRLRASLKRMTGNEFKLTPSLGARYWLDKHWRLDSELGVSIASSTETQAFIGYSYEF
jgi:hypothetical protein